MMTVLIRIFGEVQGVSFRFYTKEKARGLNVNGWVRNRVDGTVEAFFQGSEKDVLQLIEWCHKGPAAASVEKLEVSQAQPDLDISGFIVRSTC